MNNQSNQDVKMVIVVRKDLEMSIGKTSAQVAHASTKLFTDMMIPCDKVGYPNCHEIDLTEDIIQWIDTDYKKIVTYVKFRREVIEHL